MELKKTTDAFLVAKIRKNGSERQLMFGPQIIFY